MKTTKLIALILVLGITTLSFGQEIKLPDPNSNPQSICIPLQKATNIPGLVKAMHAQLNPSMIAQGSPSYTFAVRYKHSIKYVSGSLKEWKVFFLTDTVEDPDGKLAPEILLRKAIQNPNLLAAMRAQLVPSMIYGNQNSYTLPVRFSHTHYYVTGSSSDWRWFFSPVPRQDYIK